MLITCAYKSITRVVAQREFPGSYSPKVTVYYFRSMCERQREQRHRTVREMGGIQYISILGALPFPPRRQTS